MTVILHEADAVIGCCGCLEQAAPSNSNDSSCKELHKELSLSENPGRWVT